MITLWLATAWATQVELVVVPCPIGGAPTNVHHLVSQDAGGGWDSDGARYATKGQWRAYAVSTCPGNYLTLLTSDMARGLSAEEKTRLAPLLETLASEIHDPDALEVWDRYGLAVRAYEALGRDPLFLGRLWLQAAWTVRDRIVGVNAGVTGPATARTLLELGRAELAKPHAEGDRKKLLFNLAKIAHRAGWPSERDVHVAALRELAAGFTPAEREALANLERLPAVEAALLERAAGLLRDVGGSPQDRADASFLRADAQRRLGDRAAALALFAAVVDDPNARDEMRSVAAYLAAELRGGRPWEDPKLGTLQPVDE